MRFFTADQHFGHQHLVNIGLRDFPTTDKMDKHIITCHNKRIMNNDTEVYMLGDFSLKPKSHRPFYERIINKLNGRFHLILGNHDVKDPQFYLDLGFESVHTSLDLKLMNGLNVTLIHDPAYIYKYPVKNIKTQFLCGHIHDQFVANKNFLNVGVDVWDYYPASEEDILSMI